jgi:D-alanyl-lipoteichoic acid acyltransferase DltB (MBOAT superfamily)
MGFDLMQNFRTPYFSKSITEFWRRWHISLSTWFRDYVFIPLGGSRGTKQKTYINLFLVFLVSGLWHGAALTFVAWGAIHGVLIVMEKATKDFRKRLYAKLGLSNNNFSNRLFFGTITFTLVCFAWIFFRANSISDAFFIISQSMDFSASNSITTLGLGIDNMVIAIISIILLIGIEYVDKRNPLGKVLNNQSTVLRWTIYIIVVSSILLLGLHGDNTPEFIYFQF